MARPTIHLSFAPAQIEHTSAVHVVYHSAHLHPGTWLTLQRQVGTKHVWEKVMNLRPPNGRANAPSVPQGRYVYRILATYRGHNVASSNWQALFSYAPVSLSTLCQTNYINATFGSGCATGTAQVGSTVFPYSYDAFAGTYPQWNDALDTTKNTTCRAAQFSFAENPHSDSGTYPTYVELAQETRDPASASAPANTVGTMQVHLDGRPWHFDAASSVGANVLVNPDVLVNATFDCWSATGF